MVQILTILLDSLRMLLERKLFWVSFTLTALVGVAYLSTGLTDSGISFGFGWQQVDNEVIRRGSDEGEWFYISLFTTYMTRFWLGSGAIFLALLSTVSVFPEFTKPGAIEISLSKPVSRLKLFWVKYIGCLFFVALQSTLLASLVFVAIGRELGYWNFTIFWVVPLITFAFSLIHCVQVLVGVVTRSSLASLLTGVCFWIFVWMVQITEQSMYLHTYAMAEEKIAIDLGSGQLEGLEKKPQADETAEEIYQVIKQVSGPLPKVRDVTLYLDQLVRFRDSGSMLEQVDLLASLEKNDVQYKKNRAERRVRERHSASYIFLTSLGFEIAVLSLACWIFARKDY